MIVNKHHSNFFRIKRQINFIEHGVSRMNLVNFGVIHQSNEQFSFFTKVVNEVL